MRESNPQHSCVYLALQPTELWPSPDWARPSPDWATAVTRLSSGRHPYWATAVTRTELRLNFIDGFQENNIKKILKIFFSDMQSVRFLTEILWDLILICNMCVAKCLTFVKTSLAFAISPFSKGIACLVSQNRVKAKCFTKWPQPLCQKPLP